MYNERENFLRTLSGDHPDHFVNEWEPFELIDDDPLIVHTRGGVRKKGSHLHDIFGTYVMFPEDQNFAMPHVTDDCKALPDITEWRDYVKKPDLSPVDKDELWAPVLERVNAVNRKEKLVMGFMETGLFERMHYLMGFEDALCNLLVEPESCQELLQLLLEHKLEYAKILIDRIHPDIILSHDDWGEKIRLFMSPDVWREFFKPLYTELYGYIKSRGVLVMHHADSHCADIVEDMTEAHIDVWQGCLPENDIPALQARLKGKMTLMGGLNVGLVDTVYATEEVIREEVRRACAEYGPGGYFIPCITYGGIGTIYPHVDGIVKDEIAKCSPLYFKS